MIHKFSFKNFYSFKNESGVDFSVKKKAPKTHSYFKGSFGTRLIKCMTVFGSNASGKTSLLKVLPFLKWFIMDSFSQKPEEELPIKPFLFNSSIQNPTELSVEFEMQNKIFKYFLILDTKRVLFEKLKVRENKRFKRLFEREWSKKNKKYLLNIKNYNLPQGFEKLIRANASIISTATQINHELSVAITKTWGKLKTNVIEIGKFKSDASDAFYDTAKFFLNNPEFKKTADDLLIKFDLGLSGVKIIELKGNKMDSQKKPVYVPLGLHKIYNKEEYFPLSFNYESSGTKSLFLLLPTILMVLKEGGIAVLDEFDVDLHPHMISVLMDLFTSKDQNPKNAQLFFSTQHFQALEMLDKYQIFLVEKDEWGSSEVWRLDEIKGVRSNDNYYSKYNSGAYGAIPNV